MQALAVGAAKSPRMRLTAAFMRTPEPGDLGGACTGQLRDSMRGDEGVRCHNGLRGRSRRSSRPEEGDQPLVWTQGARPVAARSRAPSWER